MYRIGLAEYTNRLLTRNPTCRTITYIPFHFSISIQYVFRLHKRSSDKFKLIIPIFNFIQIFGFFLSIFLVHSIQLKLNHKRNVHVSFDHSLFVQFSPFQFQIHSNLNCMWMCSNRQMLSKQITRLFELHGFIRPKHLHLPKRMIKLRLGWIGQYWKSWKRATAHWTQQQQQHQRQ